MSLINDALKKASKPGESPTPPAASIMEPAETPQPDHGRLLLSVFVLIGLVLVAGTFFYWQGKKADSHSKTAQAAQSAAAKQERSAAADHFIKPLEQAKAVADKVSNENRDGEAVFDSFSAPANHSTGIVSTASVSPTFANSSNTVGTKPTVKTVGNVSKAATPGAVAPQSKPIVSFQKAVSTPVAAHSSSNDFPELSLNAIYYRLRGPSVVINGKTLRIGESIDGARVTDIQRMSVELEFNGQKKALALH
jgi:hypothetical protein